MELFEEIRRGYAAGETIQGLAKKHGVHRRMVRQAIASAIPPERRSANGKHPKLGPVKELSTGCWPRTAKRLGSSATRRIGSGCAMPRAPGPSDRRSHRAAICAGTGNGSWGSTAGKCSCRRATTGARRPRSIGLRPWRNWTGKPASFSSSRCAAWPRATRSIGRTRTPRSKRLLEAHELAFDYFGGVFRTLRYDNMTSVVKKILRGYQRVETDRIIAFRSHWGYQSEYCNPASGNEKGGVEGELGWFRRNWLVPVPEASRSDTH